MDAFRAVHLETVGAGELGHALHHRDLALFGQLPQAAGEFGDHVSGFPLAQLGEIHLGRTETHAVGRHFLGLRDQFRRVQQGLGGDAADVEADATEIRVALHQDDLEP